MKYFPAFKKNVVIDRNNVTTIEVAQMLSMTSDLRVKCVDGNHIRCCKNNPSIIFHNAYLPEIDITLFHNNDTVELQCLFHLKKSIQIIHYAYSFIGLVFQIAVLLSMRGMFALPCIIPVGLILYSQLLAFLGLYCQTKKVTKDIIWGQKYISKKTD